jgi:hypothetical protein
MLHQVINALKVTIAQNERIISLLEELVKK